MILSDPAYFLFPKHPIHLKLINSSLEKNASEVGNCKWEKDEFVDWSPEIPIRALTRLAFNNVKPKDWYFSLIRFDSGQD